MGISILRMDLKCCDIRWPLRVSPIEKSFKKIEQTGHVFVFKFIDFIEMNFRRLRVWILWMEYIRADEKRYYNMFGFYEC